MTSHPLLLDHHPRRFINIEGTINLRDFGGYTTQDGKVVKEGLLFRCGSMSEIPERAFDEFTELDLGVICDLRSLEEAEKDPTPDADPFSCRIHIPIWPGSSTQFQESIQKKNRPPSKEDFIEFMTNVTREIARDHVEAYKQLMRELVATENGFLLHCTAGKDRTGFGAALVLTLLGVDHATVMHDYLVSNEAPELFHNQRARMEAAMREQGRNLNIDENIVRVFSGVRAEYLLAAFDEIDNHYGGMRGYLEEIGITAGEENICCSDCSTNHCPAPLHRCLSVTVFSAYQRI